MVGSNHIMIIMSKAILLSNIFMLHPCGTGSCGRSKVAAAASFTTNAIVETFTSRSRRRTVLPHVQVQGQIQGPIPIILGADTGFGHSHPNKVLRRHHTASAKITAVHSASQQAQQTLVSTDNENENGKNYYEAEQVIKKSRFIGIAKHCKSWGAAQEFIKAVRQEHPKSRHVCFGLVCGTNPVTERCSDDGEPTGTAGVPILGGINGEELSDTVCVVVRYSGGIKLGAGGLIRAYGGTARLVLREAEREVLIPQSQISLSTPSSNAGVIYATSAKFGGVVESEEYKANGDIKATIICNTDKYDALVQEIRDSTRGDVKFEGSDNSG